MADASAVAATPSGPVNVAAMPCWKFSPAMVTVCSVPAWVNSPGVIEVMRGAWAAEPDAGTGLDSRLGLAGVEDPHAAARTAVRTTMVILSMPES
jgi:hypothetical protein